MLLRQTSVSTEGEKRLPLTHIEAETDKRGFMLLEEALRHNHRADTGKSVVTWYGNSGTHIKAQKNADGQYKIVYVAQVANDNDILAEFSVVCDPDKSRVKIHRNGDPTLADQMRARAVAFRMHGQEAKSRKYLAAYNILS